MIQNIQVVAVMGIEPINSERSHLECDGFSNCLNCPAYIQK